MADTAVSLSFEQDWTCLAEGEMMLPTIGDSKMRQYIKNVTHLNTLISLLFFF